MSFKVKKNENNRKLECRIHYSARWRYPDGEEDSDDYIYNAVIEIQSNKSLTIHQGGTSYRRGQNQAQTRIACD
ncbi:MAG TPA: hypothetical protein VFI73_05755 [Candidatus Nitrosopolaris sp.]|nr:hypothetical protein [Candidatus Nitrosopolaris sp.]